NDLAKFDTILTDYTHKIIDQEQHEGKTVYVIESIPKPHSPVVWGKQVLKVRADDIYMQSVKILDMLNISERGCKLCATGWYVHTTDVTSEYTLLDYKELPIGVDLSCDLFSVQARKRPLREHPMSIDSRMGWRTIWRNPRRSVLTLAAIAVAVALLVFMLSLQMGTYHAMIENAVTIRTGHIQV
ncbi:outer membrane lipoprotein-sorting protein, partial [Oceanidesulfovibrio marinus]